MFSMLADSPLDPAFLFQIGQAFHLSGLYPRYCNDLDSGNGVLVDQDLTLCCLD
jgi:hypothetical protein